MKEKKIFSFLFSESSNVHQAAATSLGGTENRDTNVQKKLKSFKNPFQKEEGSLKDIQLKKLP